MRMVKVETADFDGGMRFLAKNLSKTFQKVLENFSPAFGRSSEFVKHIGGGVSADAPSLRWMKAYNGSEGIRVVLGASNDWESTRSCL